MKHVWIISCLLFVCSCNTVREDFVVNEDYEKLCSLLKRAACAFSSRGSA